MMTKLNQKLTLDQPVTYQIKVPGMLDEGRSDWNGEMEAVVDSDREGRPVTILTARVDQAGLQGLLRRLYALGLPLISVLCVEVN